MKSLVSRLSNAVAIVAILIAVAALVSQCDAFAQEVQGGVGTVVLETDSGKHSFSIEIADTAAKRTMGLMYRRTLPADAGMLFIYEKPQPIFMWMKNTYIPLDMVFITADGKVKQIAENTEPFSEAPVGSGGDVLGVLELNAGTADRIGLKVGDRVVHPAFKAG